MRPVYIQIERADGVKQPIRHNSLGVEHTITISTMARTNNKTTMVEITETTENSMVEIIDKATNTEFTEPMAGENANSEPNGMGESTTAMMTDEVAGNRGPNDG